MSKTNISIKSKSSKSIDDYKIIKELGKGMAGTTYLVKLGKKEYALKIEKIAKKNIKPNLQVEEWREIEFSLKFGNLYPEQFIYLYNYDIIPNCTHQQVFARDPGYLPEDVANRIKEKNSSTYCIRKIYSLVDTDLSKIIKTLDREQIYSLIVQTAYIIYLMDCNGYSHNDLHSQNIGVIKTKRKYLSIFGVKVKTLGYQYKAIDFGIVSSKLWNKEKISNNKDIVRMITRLLGYETSIDYTLPNGKPITQSKLIDLKDLGDKFDKIKVLDEYKSLNDFSTEDKDKTVLFQLMYPEQFQKILLGKKKVTLIKPKYLIDLIDVIYFFKYKNDLVKLIKYFSLKLNGVI